MEERCRNLPDIVFDALASEHRRRIVRYFERVPRENATVDDLVDDAVATDGALGDRGRIALRLHHVALPKLARAGILEYDSERRRVRYLGSPEVARTLAVASGKGATSQWSR